MSKRYITSDSPRLARTGEYMYTTNKSSNRKPKLTWRMALKARQKARTVCVKDSRDTKYANVLTDSEFETLNTILDLNWLARADQIKAENSK